MNDRPRLIEVAFPMKQASLASVHEKNCGMGIFLPFTSGLPGGRFQPAELLNKIGGKVVIKQVKTVDGKGQEE
jgi:hypothetical protein